MFDFLRNALETFKASSIGTKLFAFFMTLVIIPVLTLSIFLYAESVKIITKQATSINELYLTQISNLLTSEISHNANAANLLAQNYEVKRILSLDPNTLSFSEEYDHMDDLSRLITNTRVSQNIHNIRIFINDDFTYSRGRPVYYPLSQVSNLDWFEQLLDENQRYVILPPYQQKYALHIEEEIVSIAAVVRSEVDMYDITGIVMADISVEYINELLQMSSFTESSTVALLDQEGKVIIGDHSYNDSLLREVNEHIKGQDDTLQIFSVGDDLIGTSAKIMDTWQVLSVTPLSDFNKANTDLRNNALLLTIAISIIAIVVVNRASKYYKRRIGTLAETMGEVEKGNLSVNIIVDSGDEIGTLQSSFNFMIRRIQTLLDETYELGQALKGVELEVLQEQINPHFLYNTLDMIYWMAKDKEDPETANIILKLAHFYRLSLQQGKDFVALADEIEQASLFVDLINLRNKKHIELIVDAEDCIQTHKILKLTIQPLIENSIIHGIMPATKDHGQIVVRVREDQSYIILEVIDDGVGMSASQLRKLMHFIDTPSDFAEAGGFGLRNTINRLRMSFGVDFSFEIHAEPERGSLVRLFIPISHSTQNNDS